MTAALPQLETEAKAEPTLRSPGARTGLRRHGAAMFVATLFVISASIVPTFAPVTIWDDWAYVRSAEFLAQGGQLEIPEPTAATGVFQAVWGALFMRLFDNSLGAARLSSIVLVFFSGFALYGLIQEVGVSSTRAALGMAVYLFIPLNYVLTFSFMSDAPFMALVVIATYCYLRGLRGENLDGKWFFYGSVVSSVAFLTRHQGIFVPAAVGCYLLLHRRVRFDRSGLTAAVSVAGLPAVILIGYYFWLDVTGGRPGGHQLFLDSANSANLDQLGRLAGNITFIAAAYVGITLIPIVLPAIFGILRPARTNPFGWLLGILGMSALVVGLLHFQNSDVRFPYARSWFNPSGLGPEDLIRTRPALISSWILTALPWVAVAAASLAVLAIAKRAGHTTSGFWVLAWLTGWQLVGIFLPSIYFNWPLDRYLIPVFPLAIVLALWALKDVRLMRAPAVVITAALAIYSVAATRDFLEFETQVWRLADRATAEGVPEFKIDAGAGWDAYHRWYPSRAKSPWVLRNGYPWWIHLWDLDTDSTYVVAAGEVAGYEVVRRITYSQWLDSQPSHLFLLRRASG